MTATEQLIAKQVSDVFPASVDDLPLGDAARRGLIAPLRCLRVPPAAAINSVPIVGGDFEERALAAALDHQALNQAAASLYRDRFGSTPGHRVRRRRRARLQPRAGVPRRRAEGRGGLAAARRRCELAETLAAYERGEINVLINAHAPRRGLELAARDGRACTSRRPRRGASTSSASAGSCGSTRARRPASSSTSCPRARRTRSASSSLHALLDSDFYREGARVTPAPRRRQQRRARRKLSPAPWLVPVTPDVRRRLAVIQREWQRIDPKYLDDDEQRFWATIAGRQIRFDQRAEFAKKFTEGRAGKGALEQFLSTCAAENPNRRLRMTALRTASRRPSTEPTSTTSSRS